MINGLTHLIGGLTTIVASGGNSTFNLATTFNPVLSLQSDKGVTQTGAGVTATAWVDQSSTGEVFTWNTITKVAFTYSDGASFSIVASGGNASAYCTATYTGTGSLVGTWIKLS